MDLNGLAVVFLLVNSIALFTLSRRWAPMPLLIGACYMTLGQGIEIGPFTFTVIRILVTVGLVRVVARRERLVGGMNGLDRLMVVWACWALVSSAFHADRFASLVFRLGLVFNTCGIYFLLRVFCQSLDDLAWLCRITAILLGPVALEMLNETMTGYNLFSVFGGVAGRPAFRDAFRAQGPFRHSILAGTVGAVCLPLMIGLWRQYRKAAALGIGVCLAMVFASGSTGPMLIAMTGIGALFLWRVRHRMRLIRWLAVFGYIGLDLVMKAPAYYLMARTGATGHGWHRARLIESSIEYLHEWWLAGTDYTRHWMPGAVPWNPDHADITNHYIQMGVWGGLPLTVLFIFILLKGFSYVGERLKNEDYQNPGHRFFLWALGASLFANAAAMISVSYFDQSFVFLYLALAAIGSLWSAGVQSAVIQGATAGKRFSTTSEMQPTAVK